MTVRLSTGLRNNLAGPLGFGSTFDKGVIYIYSGPQPLSADAPVSGTLLGIVTKDGGAFSFGAPENGLTFDVPVGGAVSKSTDAWRLTGLAEGTAGWFRLMGNTADALGASAVKPRLDGTCGTTGADLNVSNISIVVGAPTTIDVFQFAFPA